MSEERPRYGKQAVPVFNQAEVAVNVPFFMELVRDLEQRVQTLEAHVKALEDTRAQAR